MMYDLTKVSSSNPTGLNNYISRKTTPSPYEILPGIFSSSPACQELLAKLHDRLSDALPPSKPSGAVLASPGIPDEWPKLLNIMGVPHDPEGVPPFSTQGYKEVLSTVKTGARQITTSLAPRSLERAKWLAARMVSRSPLRPIHIKREVTVGIPHMSAAIEIKHAIADMWHKQWRDIAALIRQRDMYTLAARFGIVFCFFVGRRYQPDKVRMVDGKAKGKDRVVMDWHGKWLTADKTLPDVVERCRYTDRFLCCRSRKISASPLAATYPLRAVAKEIENHLHYDIPFLFHHTTPEEIGRKIGAGLDLYMLDVDNHDVNMPPALRDIFLRAVGRVFGSFYETLSTLTYRMPQLIKNDYRNGAGCRLDGNPYDATTFVADYVNCSGHPFTSLLAKYAGAFYVMDALCEDGSLPDNEEGWLSFCRGTSKVRALVAGDNVVVKGHTSLERLQEHSRYALYSATETFLGLVATKAGSELVWQPNICSYVNNYFVPGRPINSRQRGDWAAGWLERTPIYAKSLSFEIAHDIVNSTTLEVLGYRMDDYAESRRSKAVVVGRSAVDNDFLLDPDVIYYKHDIDQVTPNLVEEFFLTVSPLQYGSMHEGLMNTGGY
jgi:hypothetical protein